MNQPDNEEPFDEASVVQRDDETKEEWETRKWEERVYRGSIEAIKLGTPMFPEENIHSSRTTFPKPALFVRLQRRDSKARGLSKAEVT
jgi:hypothetical protein